MTWGLDFQDYDSDPLHDLDGVLGRLVELLGVVAHQWFEMRLAWVYG